MKRQQTAQYPFANVPSQGILLHVASFPSLHTHRLGPAQAEMRSTDTKA